jgi:hypothetical protein
MYMNTDCLASAAECRPSGVSNSRFMVLKKLSAQTLPRQFPVRLRLCLTAGHNSRGFLRKEAAQYRTPLSE